MSLLNARCVPYNGLLFYLSSPFLYFVLLVVSIVFVFLFSSSTSTLCGAGNFGLLSIMRMYGTHSHNILTLVHELYYFRLLLFCSSIMPYFASLYLKSFFDLTILLKKQEKISYVFCKASAGSFLIFSLASYMQPIHADSIEICKYSKSNVFI